MCTYLHACRLGHSYLTWHKRTFSIHLMSKSLKANIQILILPGRVFEQAENSCQTTLLPRASKPHFSPAAPTFFSGRTRALFLPLQAPLGRAYYEKCSIQTREVTPKLEIRSGGASSHERRRASFSTKKLVLACALARSRARACVRVYVCHVILSHCSSRSFTRNTNHFQPLQLSGVGVNHDEK